MSVPKNGLGLYKLQFYSPQNFTIFPKVFQQENTTFTFGLGHAYGFVYCGNIPNPPDNAG